MPLPSYLLTAMNFVFAIIVIIFILRISLLVIKRAFPEFVSMYHEQLIKSNVQSPNHGRSKVSTDNIEKIKEEKGVHASGTGSKELLSLINKLNRIKKGYMGEQKTTKDYSTLVERIQSIITSLRALDNEQAYELSLETEVDLPTVELLAEKVTRAEIVPLEQIEHSVVYILGVLEGRLNSLTVRELVEVETEISVHKKLSKMYKENEQQIEKYRK